MPGLSYPVGGTVLTDRHILAFGGRVHIRSGDLGVITNQGIFLGVF